MAEEVSLRDLETEFIKLNKEIFQLIQTTSEGEINKELLTSVKEKKIDITEIIEKVTDQIPRNFSCVLILSDIEKLKDKLDEYNSFLEKRIHVINQNKERNYEKLCEITNNFLI